MSVILKSVEAKSHIIHHLKALVYDDKLLESQKHCIYFNVCHQPLKMGNFEKNVIFYYVTKKFFGNRNIKKISFDYANFLVVQNADVIHH